MIIHNFTYLGEIVAPLLLRREIICPSVAVAIFFSSFLLELLFALLLLPLFLGVDTARKGITLLSLSGDFLPY